MSKLFELFFKRNYCYWIELKTLWQKGKLLVLSNFYFWHNVFKSRLLQRHQRASLCGKGLNNICAQVILRDFRIYLLWRWHFLSEHHPSQYSEGTLFEMFKEVLWSNHIYYKGWKQVLKYLTHSHLQLNSVQIQFCLFIMSNLSFCHNVFNFLQ